MIIAITVIAAYLIILGDFTMTYSSKKTEIKLEYNGLLWVYLDYWSIWKYKSDDKPMKILKVTRQLYGG
ncbi:MAG: hypothetical protein Q8P20_05640 [bacterium]|nr:hypothetical protein [bacterium]